MVSDHERAHAAHIRKALGAGAPKARDLRLRRHQHAPRAASRDAAIKLEELGLAAYNGAAASLTPEALADASRIVSVEARHAVVDP